MAIVNMDEADAINLPPLDKEDGSSFGYYDRMMFGWRDGMVFDYGDWEARDLLEMMGKDYTARQLESVLSLPIISAEHQFVAGKGDSGELAFLQDFWDADHFSGGSRTPLDQIIAQMTSAITYKKAFFEKVWVPGKGDFEGKIVYKDVAWRPQTTCRTMRDPQNGHLMGFEQQAYYVGPEITKGHWPITIPKNRAFIYIHGQRRDPLNGTSDMEIAYWCYKTKQKIMFLWFQFLESVALPRVVVKANDQDTARQIASQMASLKGSGIIPVSVPQGPNSVGIDILDSSGKGADQFTQAIQWLDNAARNAVLAGFLNLTDRGTPMSGTGSFALSEDASDFFLQSLESKCREIEYSIRKDLFAPLVRYNFGPKAIIPTLKFEPLNAEDKSSSISLLTAAMALPSIQSEVPSEFVADLAAQVANYIGLDGTKTLADFQAAAKKAEANAAAMAKLNPAMGAAGPAAGLAGVVQHATGMVKAHQAANGITPAGPPALAAATGGAPNGKANPAAATKA